jgi:hypothetical protein
MRNLSPVTNGTCRILLSCPRLCACNQVTSSTCAATAWCAPTLWCRTATWTRVCAATTSGASWRIRCVRDPRTTSVTHDDVTCCRDARRRLGACAAQLLCGQERRGDRPALPRCPAEPENFSCTAPRQQQPCGPPHRLTEPPPLRSPPALCGRAGPVRAVGHGGWGDAEPELSRVRAAAGAGLLPAVRAGEF